MRTTYERGGTKARLTSLAGHTVLQTWRTVWKKWMRVEKNAVNGILETFAPLYTLFHTPRFRKFLKFFRTSIASLDPETVQLPAFSILSTMFTGACGLPEKLSLALVPRSNVLRMIVKLAYKTSLSCYDDKRWILEEASTHGLMVILK